MRPSGSPEELERRRRRAIALLQQGMAPVEVARMVGVDRRFGVRRWRVNYDRDGPAGVGAATVTRAITSPPYRARAPQDGLESPEA